MFSWVVNGVGIVISAIGTVLLFIGSPKARFGAADLMLGSEDDPDVKASPKAKEALRKRQIARVGVFLLMIGFILQFIGWILEEPGVIHFLSDSKTWINIIGMLIALGGTVFALLVAPKGDPPRVSIPGEETIDEWAKRDHQYKLASYGNVAIIIGLCIQFASAVFL